MENVQALSKLTVSKPLEQVPVKGHPVPGPDDGAVCSYRRPDALGIENSVGFNCIWQIPSEVEGAEYLKRETENRKGRKKEFPCAGWFGIFRRLSE